jgi:hypothetical protein
MLIINKVIVIINKEIVIRKKMEKNQRIKGIVNMTNNNKNQISSIMKSSHQITHRMKKMIK